MREEFIKELNKSIEKFEEHYNVDTETIKDVYNDGMYLSKKMKIKGYLNDRLKVVKLKFYGIFKINKEDKSNIICDLIININDRDVDSIRGNYIDGTWLGLEWSEKL